MHSYNHNLKFFLQKRNMIIQRYIYKTWSTLFFHPSSNSDFSVTVVELYLLGVFLALKIIFREKF